MRLRVLLPSDSQIDDSPTVWLDTQIPEGAEVVITEDYKVQSDTDAIGFLIKFIVTTVHGTGTYAGAARG